MSNEERGCCDAKTCQKENTVVFQFSNIYLSEALKCVDVGHKYSKKYVSILHVCPLQLILSEAFHVKYL